jgi:hypothetical protein
LWDVKDGEFLNMWEEVKKIEVEEVETPGCSVAEPSLSIALVPLRGHSLPLFSAN